MIEQAMVVSLVFVVLYVILVLQSATLARWYGASSYYLHSIGWVLLGCQRLWRFYQIPSQWMRLRDQGWQPPAHLPMSEWVATGVIMAALVLFIIGYDRRRVALRDL